MIPNQWYVILETKELKRSPIKIKRIGEELVVWRDREGKACCIADRCCHRGASLSCGRITGNNLECPFHGFVFDASGKVKRIPANGLNTPVPVNMKVNSYELYEDFGLIWMWYGEREKITQKPFFFSELKDYSYASFQDHWRVHYSRAIENQLDVVHLPFVHRTTIGKGNKTLVNGPVVEREGDLITFYVNNMVDDGITKPLKPEEIKDYRDFFHLRFHFPNIWQNYISGKIRAFAAFVPVDEENSLIYIRYYQQITKIPVIRHLINWIGILVSVVILRQDKRVVETQLPKKSAWRMDENLITGDRPIVEYRRHRESLIEAGSL
jgi:phenylpropionate dioxygenase-like ring-hydroxylating dioxygenase large terminal subunit